MTDPVAISSKIAPLLPSFHREESVRFPDPWNQWSNLWSHGRRIQYRPLQLKTPSGKIEIISEKLEKHGISSLKPYSSPEKPPEGRFRLTLGRCALHTQGHTANNPVLSDQMPENRLWLNASVAERLGISDGDLVRVSQNGYSERIKASVTYMIHPEAVFVVDGFGHTLPLESRAFGRGLADNKFMKDGLECWDEAGGGLALQEHFVEIRKDKPLSSP